MAKTIYKVKEYLNRLSQTKLNKVFIHINKLSLPKKITLLCFGVSFPFIIIFPLMNLQQLVSSVVIFCISFLFSLILYNLNKNNLASFWLIMTGNLALFYYSYNLGKASGVYLIYFAFFSIPFFIFKFHQKKEIIFSVFISIMCFTYLHYFFSLPYGSLITLAQQHTLSNYMNNIAITLSLLSVYFYTKKNIDSEKKLKVALKEAQERKLQLEKVSQQAAFTRLTMGISHEIRNPMASMLTRTEIVEDNPEDTAAVLKFADIIKKNIKRILKITETMLKYGNPVSAKKESVQIVDLIDEILDLIQGKSKRKRIRIHRDISTLPQKIMLDPIQIHQALINIIINGVESMEDKGGTLTIRCYEKENPTEALIGQFIAIVISDTGCGMSDEDITHIFDPFYSTKYENSGLGLSISLKCIHHNNGTIHCQSLKGEGTTFSLYFPLSNNDKA